MLIRNNSPLNANQDDAWRTYDPAEFNHYGVLCVFPAESDHRSGAINGPGRHNWP
jgi:hypothetical protein